jgi:hypothetical protein
MPRIISTGALKGILREHAEEPERGEGFIYVRLPHSVTAQVWETLSEGDRAFYEADHLSFVIDPPKMGEVGSVTRTGRYTRFVLPVGSYDAWMVNR